MKLSVITICYNEKNIRKTCESIVSQTWQDFEWIVVDGGSTDGTLDILNEYKDRINILISEPDKGIYNAMNKGIKRASGEWLNFMNGGDSFYNKDVLQKVFGNNQNYNASILYGWMYFSYRKYTRKYEGEVNAEYFISKGIGHQASFIRRDLFKKYGLYNEKIKIIGDTEKFIKFALGEENFKYLPFYIADFYDCGISSSMTEQTKLLHIKERISILKKYYSVEDIMKFGRSEEKIYFVHPIITLTSYPARIQYVAQTIKTLLSQTVPAQIVLWLGKDEFPNKDKDLPSDLTSLLKEGLQIKYTKDIGAYTKLIPALKAFPERVLITADDDILYPKEWLRNLLEAYVEKPEMIHAARCHQILFKNKKIAPYNEWIGEAQKLTPSFNNFLTGVGGVLYPPHCLYQKDVLKEDVFLSLSPKADDIWYWAMAVMNNVKINLIAKPYSKLQFVSGSQEGQCLWKTNVSGRQNDTQLQAVLSRYPEIMKKLDHKKKITSEHTTIKSYLFSFIPILKIKENDKKSTKVYYFLNLIPVWKIKKSEHKKKTRHYLFGIIPILKIKR